MLIQIIEVKDMESKYKTSLREQYRIKRLKHATADNFQLTGSDLWVLRSRVILPWDNTIETLSGKGVMQRQLRGGPFREALESFVAINAIDAAVNYSYETTGFDIAVGEEASPGDKDFLVSQIATVLHGPKSGINRFNIG